ncbi:hypothetical protein [Nocardiopsis alborubida]|uniref:Uncharacterized protein n=1 Tax=Nocardiopsis alborubida TaxID=146802 RepID=A0A7X6MF81_9ACTN|nr:hypothetical protein [Nocardiopsis alborubida]NKZ00444.1 hypothetical protein [Nocardiopsis alborubida]
MPWTWFTALENDREQGFAYWWDGTAWDRIDYPDLIDDDGLGLLLPHLSATEKETERVLRSPTCGLPRRSGTKDPFSRTAPWNWPRAPPEARRSVARPWTRPWPSPPARTRST